MKRNLKHRLADRKQTRSRLSYAGQISLLGLVLALVGTVLVNTSSYRPLRFIPALVSRLDERDAAWSALTAFDIYNGELGANTSISTESPGFQSLLDLLDRHLRLTPGLVATDIKIDGQMLYGDDVQKIGRFAMTVHYQGEDDSRVVAWVEDVSGWIEDERFRWALTFGMPVLCLGLLLSLVSGVVGKRKA